MVKRIPKNIQQIKPYVPGKPIEELQKEKGLSKVIKLASNENAYGPSPKALEAMQKAFAQVQLYPDTDCFVLRKELGEFYNIPMDWIVAGCGSMDLLQTLAISFLNKNNSAIISAGSFIMYPIVIMIAGGNFKSVPMKNRTHDLSEMLKAIDKTTRMIFVANPNNPTGTWNKREEWESFIEKVPKDVIVVLDEAYFEYATDKDYPNGMDYVAKYPNIFLMRSFSKIYALAGMRVGYGISSNPKLIEVIRKVRSPFDVNSLAQVAAIASLHDREHVKMTVTRNNEQIKFLSDELEKRKFVITPTQTNFILTDTPESIKASTLCEKLFDQGVSIRPMSGAWGFPDSVRISVGTHEENLFFLEALDKILASK